MNYISSLVQSFRQRLVKGKRRSQGVDRLTVTRARRARFEPLEDRRLLAVLRVDCDATGGNTGTDWLNAFVDLQSALTAAAASDEIWVAEGTYKPTAGADRTVSFDLKSNVALYGGFAGTETARSDRSWTTHITTLSGDIGTSGNASDNSYSVVRASNVANAILDGFTITAGSASSTGMEGRLGGGMLNQQSSPTLVNLTFSKNSARTAGGGMVNVNSAPTLVDCTFNDNSAMFGGTGGGMYNYQSAPSLTNVTFNQNIADQGGGLKNEQSSPALTNVVFFANVATLGGGVYNYSSSSPVLTNVTFANNTASGSGGAIANSNNCTPKATNCILWGNVAGASPQIFDDTGCSTTVTYSIVQGGRTGTGNKNANPLFANATNGDLHLLAGSPAIDAGTNTGAPASDMDGVPRPQNGDGNSSAITDMGAYEYPGPPLVTALVVNDTLLTDADAGIGKFTVAVTYNEPMKTSIAPAITFTPAVSSTLTLASGVWSESTHYIATYNVIDANAVASSVSIKVASAQDAAGNVQTNYTGSGKFGIEMDNPTVTELVVNDTFLTNADVGIGKFVVTVAYSEPMESSQSPTISFTPDVSSTLTLLIGVWLDSEHFEATYNVADANIMALNVGIKVVTAQDTAGNSQIVYVGSNNFSVDTQNLSVQSIARVGNATTSAGTVQYVVTFSDPAVGVDFSDFQVFAPDLSGAAVSSVGGSGMVYTVTVNTGSGSGTLRLDVIDDDSIFDTIGNPLGGWGTGNGDFTAGECYTIDRLGPTVFSVVKMDADPTTATVLHFQVTFSETVIGVSAASFAIIAPNMGLAQVVGVSGSGAIYAVAVDRGRGNGTLQLDVTDNDSIQDLYGNPLGGTGPGNGYFAGPKYTIKTTSTIGLFDPATARFHLRDSNSAGSDDYSFGFGVANGGWTPLVGDWNGDGAKGVGLYNPTTSRFYLTSSLASGVAEYSPGFGVPNAGWVPLVGDWDGDGRAGIGLYDPKTSFFYLTNALTTGTAQYAFGYGVPNGGWTPLVGDWDGDGRMGVGLYNPKTSTFYLTNALSTGVAQYTFGYGVANGGWTPLVGDWNGDGRAGVGLYNPKTSRFYLTNTLTTGYAEFSFGYGAPNAGWQPMVGDWNSDGSSGVGLYDPKTSNFYLKNTLTTGFAETAFHYGTGNAGWIPLTGCWTIGSPLLAADGQGTSAGDAATLDSAELPQITTEAIARWATAGASTEALSAMAQANILVASLSGNRLGEAVGQTIYLDRDAAGHGWFVDATPAIDEEFAPTTGRAIDPAAVDRIDLLTVVEHELGHVAGLKDLDAALDMLMSAELPTGARRLPGIGEIDAVLTYSRR